MYYTLLINKRRFRLQNWCKLASTFSICPQNPKSWDDFWKTTGICGVNNAGRSSHPVRRYFPIEEAFYLFRLCISLIAQVVIRNPNDLTWKTQLFRTIWLLIFAVMLGLTIHTVVVFFIDYIGYPVTTTVTMKHYDWVSSLIDDIPHRALVDCSVHGDEWA